MGRLCTIAVHRFLVLVVTAAVVSFGCSSSEEGTGGAGGAAGPDGPGATFTYAELTTFYSDFDAPAGIGICVDCTVWADNPVCQ
jgi:hypothetical protein